MIPTPWKIVGSFQTIVTITLNIDIHSIICHTSGSKLYSSYLYKGYSWLCLFYVI